jgi:hypothetical protein
VVAAQRAERGRAWRVVAILWGLIVYPLPYASGLDLAHGRRRRPMAFLRSFPNLFIFTDFSRRDGTYAPRLFYGTNQVVAIILCILIS